MRFLDCFFRLGKNILYEEAIQFYNNHEYARAIEKFEIITKEVHSQRGLHYRLSHFYLGQAHLKLGTLLFAAGSFSKAVPELKKAIEFNPDNIDIYEYLGVCYNNIGKFEKAINALECCFLEREANHLQSRLKLEITCHNIKMWEKAISIFKAILQKSPNYADVHFYLGLAYLGKGEAPKAVLSFKNALRINPLYRDARIKLGITFAFLGNLDAALSQISQMVEAFPKYPDLRYFLGIVYAGRDELPRAIDCFRHALEINPSFRNARIKLGMILCKIGKFSDALNEFEKAQELDPEDGKLNFLIERVRQIVLSYPQGFQKIPEIFNELFGDEGIIAQTIQEFNSHLELVPNFTEMLSIIEYFPEEDLSFFESLIPVINNYIEQNPHHPDLHNALGTLCVKAKRYDEGAEAFRAALDINPEYLEARFNLFKALKAQEQFEAAAKEGKILIEKKLPYPDFYCSLGEMYSSMNMIYKADAILQKARNMSMKMRHPFE
jgi:tetratricopeptide (TPR) repeat protein